MSTVRQQLAFSLFTDFENFTTFTPATLHNDSAAVMFALLEGSVPEHARYRRGATITGTEDRTPAEDIDNEHTDG